MGTGMTHGSPSLAQSLSFPPRPSHFSYMLSHAWCDAGVGVYYVAWGRCESEQQQQQQLLLLLLLLLLLVGVSPGGSSIYS